MTRVQATVKRWDGTHGVVLLDDGSELDFKAAVLEELRGLRLGQRVRLVVEDGRITRVSLPV